MTITTNKPKLLINIFSKQNPLTDYNNIISNVKLSNSLFIYLSNNMNSGYAGGSGGGTASIGCRKNTYGVITGSFDNMSHVPVGGFQNLEETNTFKLYDNTNINSFNNNDNIYIITPKNAIDYLIKQLSKILCLKKYEYIILPCEEDPESTYSDYRKYTIGAKIFNTHPIVKKYIFNSIVNLTCADDENGWTLITDFLK